MGKHQIIYTSCRRGIDGDNDGQQVFSYSAGFTDSTNDEILRLFAYQAPEIGAKRTEESAKVMPQSFTYRRLGSGFCAMSLNTFLGRDYMGTGRFGYHLSHAVVCDEENMVGYPCEFYSSDFFRSHMEHSEVNSPDRPPHLPEPVLDKGDRVDIDKVMEFLSVCGRMEIFKKMLSAMLAYRRAKKRMLICDEPENIIMWIAALHYSLPKKVALNVNFTTYEFNPPLSISQICGVIPKGSRYTPNDAAMHFTFDFIHNIVPEIEAKGDFYDFIDMGMSISYESLQDFHEFVSSKLNYPKANQQYLDIYSLYCLLTDGLGNITLEAFMGALQASKDYAPDTLMMAIAERLTTEKDVILKMDDEYSLEVINVILGAMPNFSENLMEIAKSVVALKVIASLSSETATRDSFAAFYAPIKRYCNEHQICIPHELIKDVNRDVVVSLMKNESASWKWEFIVADLCDYALMEPTQLDQLSMDFPVGHFIGKILMSIFSTDAQCGLIILSTILEKFSREWMHLSNMALNIESVLHTIPSHESEITALWECFYRIAAKNQFENRLALYNTYLSLDRHGQVFGIFKEMMAKTPSLKEAKSLFVEQIGLANMEYLQSYEYDIYDIYYKYLSASKSEDVITAKHELLQVAMQKGLTYPFVDGLIADAVAGVPFATPSKEDKELVATLLDYRLGQNPVEPTDRLLLLAAGMVWSEVKNRHDLEKAGEHFASMTKNERIILPDSDSEAEKYLAWIIPFIFSACESSGDLLASYTMFEQSKPSSDLFVVTYAKEALNKSKDGKEYNSILEFLDFVFSLGDADLKKLGAEFSTLGKQNLEALDAAVKLRFKEKPAYLIQWDEIREITAKTNPLLQSFVKGFGGLFKKK